MNYSPRRESDSADPGIVSKNGDNFVYLFG